MRSKSIKWMKDKAVLMFLAMLLLACGFAFGAYYGLVSSEPKVVVREVEVDRPVYIQVSHVVTEYVEVEKIVEVPVEIVKEVEVPVKVEVPVDKVVYRNHYIEEFEDVKAFKEWAESKLTYLMPSPVYEVDCDDYALHLQRAALQEGKLLSLQLIEGNGYLYGRKVVSGPGYHMGNLLVIGNAVYYVEPHPDEFEVVKICDLD